MNRLKFITNIVKNKDVIDVGGIGHNIKREKDSSWIHSNLVKNANYVLGVDILKEDVEKAKRLGYNFVVGNAEKLDQCVDRQFDVCVAGELIEHLANPGLFLESAKKVLKNNGILVITTPNVFSFGNIFRILKYAFRIEKISKDINKEHKTWYCFQTLTQLVESFGFKVTYISSLRPERESNLKSHIKEKLYGYANSKIICVAEKI